MSFLQRETQRHLDGSRIFSSPRSRAREDAVARELEEHWGCKLVRFPELSTVDFYGVRFERMVGVVECKCRSHECGTYPTVFLALRKWSRLQELRLAADVPALFVAGFTDKVGWVSLGERGWDWDVVLGGCEGDREPCFDVPVGDLTTFDRRLGEAAP